MAPRSTLPLYDLVHNGAVSKSMQTWRTDGLSVPEIARRLDTVFAIAVGERTVYRWLEEIERVAS